jgi:2-iminobutanoate/2-iminopropanoate deaminase
MRHIQTEKAPAAVGTYSQGVELNGTFFFSGQIGLHPETMEIAEDVDTQITQILSNIDGLLESQDLTRKNIVKTTIFLTDLGDFGKVNQAYEQYFEQPYPARSCVEVSALPKACNVEIEVIAAR